MNYASVRTCDIANGPGVRVSLFVSGCSHKCPGCFNEEAWDYNYGKEFTDEVLNEIITSISLPGRIGFTVLGGEPLDPQNRKEVNRIITEIRSLYPSLSIWVYTGGVYESLTKENDPDLESIFDLIDVLVDGPFVMDKKNLMLNFRGSSNQRIINMVETRRQEQVILHELNN